MSDDDHDEASTAKRLQQALDGLDDADEARARGMLTGAQIDEERLRGAGGNECSFRANDALVAAVLDAQEKLKSDGGGESVDFDEAIRRLLIRGLESLDLP